MATRNKALAEVARQSEIIDVPGDEYALVRAIEELSGDDEARVYVYREGANSRDKVFISDIEPDEFRVPMLQGPPYNGGKFRVQLRNGAGQLVKNELIRVESIAKPEEKPAEKTNDTAALIAAIADGNAQTQAVLLKLGEMISAATQRPPERSTKDILGELQAMRNIIAPVVETPRVDPLDMLTKTLAMVRELPLGGGDDAPRGATGMDVLYKLAAEWLPKIMEGIRVAQTQQPPNAMRPDLRLVQPPITNPVQPEQSNDAMLTLKTQLQFLVAQAAKMVDPAPYAEMIVDNAPRDWLQSFASNPRWFEEICELVPQAQPYRVWFDGLYSEVVGILNEDAADLTPENEQAHTPVVNGPTASTS